MICNNIFTTSKEKKMLFDIKECFRHEDCTGLSDNCTPEGCKCGINQPCNAQTSDNCNSGTCRCGINAACPAQAAFCKAGSCVGK